MSRGYRLEILGIPDNQQTINITSDFQNDGRSAITHMRVERKRDGKERLSYLTATFWDPKNTLLPKLPDPSFFQIPINLFVGSPAQGTQTTNIFAGRLTSLQLGYPSPKGFTLVAHDESVVMRVNAIPRTFKRMNSVQLVAKIASEYGFTVNSSNVIKTLKIREFHFQGKHSDWAFCAQALKADGLGLYMDGSSIVVHEFKTTQYPTTFKRDDGKVIKLEAMINHVPKPGHSGNIFTVKSPLTLNGLILPTTLKKQLKEYRRQGAQRVTDMRPVQGTLSTSGGAHSEDMQGSPWQDQIDGRRQRKDHATLSITPTFDIGLHHAIELHGWGGKFDTDWAVDGIVHEVAGSEFQCTNIMLTREVVLTPKAKEVVAQGLVQSNQPVPR